MGMIQTLFGMLFGGGRNVIRDTATVFGENADDAAARSQELRLAALAQMGAELQLSNKTHFDRFIDGLNRLPRPLMAFGTLGLLVAAMVDPIWFAARMQGVALVPEPLWWLLGVIVTFYFGARHQLKSQDYHRDLSRSLARLPQVVENLHEITTLNEHPARIPDRQGRNPALEDWHQSRVRNS
ncbi:carboxylesterase [Epibacterium sp. SM1969]|uniref:Carboxylesterase n=1 Tax=Tritonibacter aquimaris TaxID=2663379 RepID=A0A844AR58_9RHOB|nr:holin family protein [Tritonibacter aquimaris]MQY41568.1 carboxylesterase [Tritonibacter aquimaris]